MQGFTIRRDMPVGLCPFPIFARGIETSPALTRFFGSHQALRDFISKVEVEVTTSSGYMWIDDEAGRIVVSQSYLRQAEDVVLYLDLVHEMVHLGQLAQGRDLFDSSYTYDRRPTELEAYAVTLEEARRLGFSDEFLREYLRVEWMTPEQHQNMQKSLGVNPR